MQNIGIKSYSKNFEKDLPIGKAFINLCPAQTNVIIKIPLVEQLGIDFIFNYLAKDQIGTMGKGGHSSLYKNVYNTTITNADFSVDYYSYDVKNNETGLTLSRVSIGNGYGCELKDPQNNVIKYDNVKFRAYPKELVSMNGETRTITTENNKIYVNSNDYSAEITVADSGFFQTIEVKRNYVLIQTIQFEYQNNFLSKIKFISPRGGTRNIPIVRSTVYGNEAIEVRDELTQEGTRFVFENSKIHEIDRYRQGVYTNEFGLSFNEAANIGIISDNSNTVEYHFFEKRTIGNKDYYFSSLYANTDGTVSCEYTNDEFKVAYSHIYDKSLIDGAIIKNASLEIFNTNCTSYSPNVLEQLFVGNTAQSCYGLNVTKNFDIRGNGTDTFVLTCLVKSADTNSCEITGWLNDSSSTIKVANNWKMLCVKLDVKKSFEQLKIALRSTGSIVIGGINVFKNKFAKFYSYDQSGNNLNDDSSSIAYENNMVSSVIDGDGARYYVEYDERKNLTGFRSPNGVTVSLGYNDDNRVVEQSIQSSGHNIHYFQEYDGDRLVFEGGDKPVVRYEYDEYGAIKKVYDGFWKYIETEYDRFGRVISLIGRESSYDEEGYAGVSYGYDEDNGKLKTVTIANGTTYTFTYDNLSRLETVLMKNVCFFRFDYNDLGDISRQYFGATTHYIQFEYNEKRQISRVSYSEAPLSYNYTYDEYDRLVEIKEVRGTTETIVEAYEYDEQGQLVVIRNDVKELSKILDNNNCETRSKNTFNNKTVIQEYDTASRSRGSNPETILGELSKNDYYNVAPLINDYNCVGKANGFACCSRRSNRPLVGVPERDGTIPYISQYNRPCYIVTGSVMQHTCESVAFWFKASSHKTNACLFFAGNDGRSSNKGSLAIYERSGSHFEVVVTDYQGNSRTLITTSSSSHYSLNKWTFISLTYYSRDDGPAYGFEGEVCLRVNNKLYRRTLSGYQEYCDLTISELEMDLGFKMNYFDENNRIQDEFTGSQFALIAIGKRCRLQDSAIYDYYRKTKDYFIDNVLVDNADFYAADCSVTRLLKAPNANYGNFKVFPLDNNVFSLDYDPIDQDSRDMPYRFDVRQGSENDKDITFNYNKLLNRYAFAADGNVLSYKVPLGQSGTIAGSFYVDENNDIQYLFEAKSQNSRFALYRNSDGHLVVRFDNSEHITRFVMQPFRWYNIALSTDVTIQSDSGSTSTTRVFRVTCNNAPNSYDEETCSFLERYTFNEFEVILGRSFDERTVGSTWDPIVTCCALFGQIANFAYCSAYCNVATIRDLFDKLEGFSKIKFYDELGFLRQEEIKNKKNTIYTKKVEQSIPSFVISETFETASKTIRKGYLYDRLGNLTHVTYDLPSYSQKYYQYDSRGFLISEDNNGTVTYYSYDKNGNITSKNDKIFEYDPSCPDRLIRYNGSPITYDSNMPLNVSSYNGWAYEYEGRRLKKATKTTTTGPRFAGITRELTVEFDYDDKGLRTSKIVTIRQGSRTSPMTLFSRDVYNYEYDDTDLVYEKHTGSNSPTREVFYLYDENKTLYGLISNGTKYFYIRDAYQNILGLVNENGEVVAEYDYDAYGNKISETGSVYNPIRYKGYYYDSEVQMFYCKSRYYVPEWCRWLNADSIGFLQEKDINKLNLFAYCCNNPVTAIDPDGHSISFLIGLGIAILIGALVGAAGYTIAETVSYAVTGKWSWSWGQFAGCVLGGALGGALSFICPAAPAALIGGLTGFSSTAFGMLFQNAWEGTNYSTGEILLCSFISGLVSAGTTVLSNAIKLPGISSGRGSYAAISKQITTKFINGTIRRITLNTFSKMLTYQLTANLIGAIVSGLMDAFNINDRIVEYIRKLIQSW